jgi:hypothetical protein
MTTHFWGPVANWGLVGSAAYDAYFKGPEIVSLTLTPVMMVYSGLFMRFAWCVNPRNYLLLACHTFNVAAQSNQLRRGLEYKLREDPAAIKEIKAIGEKAAVAAALVAGSLLARKPLQNSMLGTTFYAEYFIKFYSQGTYFVLCLPSLML